jgi:hypothetical protein
MIHIRNDAEAVEFAARHTKSSACRTAFCEGKVKVLGRFSEIPPSPYPGWIIRVTTRHGKIFLVVVTVDEDRHEYRTWFTNAIPYGFLMPTI